MIRMYYNLMAKHEPFTIFATFAPPNCEKSGNE